jgi:hypothetical protein
MASWTKWKEAMKQRSAEAKKKVTKPEAKNPKKKEFILQSDEYKRGWRDVDKMVQEGFSPYFVHMTILHLGFCRKVEGKSDQALYDYCEGCNDRVGRLFGGKTPSPSIRGPKEGG